MRIWIRDINWIWTLYKTSEEVNEFIRKNSNEYDFICLDVVGSPICEVHLAMVRRS